MSFKHLIASPMVQAAVAGLILSLSAGRLSAQRGPVSGIYQITDGSFTECCGFAGTEFTFPLPDESQSYVRFTVDASQTTATLSFLGPDARSVFVFGSYPLPGVVPFNFDQGAVGPDQTVFTIGAAGGSPSPAPILQAVGRYTVRHGAGNLKIDGSVRLLRPLGADVPTQFGHQGVTATLLPAPRLTLLERSKENAARIRVQGQSGWTDVVEASGDLVNWTAISTNVMDYSLCPICPYAIVEDSASRQASSRFYRALEYR